MDENLQKSTDAVNFAIVANLLCTIAKAGAFIYTGTLSAAATVSCSLLHWFGADPSLSTNAGSGSVLSETLHSMADLANQALLAIGIYRSKKGPTEAHPYGFAGERFVWALISAVGLFFCGAAGTLPEPKILWSIVHLTFSRLPAASVYHGVNIFLHPHELESLHVALTVLGISIVLESLSLAVAIRAISAGTPWIRFLES
jgi:divalent metal cation (Fe/Co/Zn/Cd) transporter